ncbi:hypothetical protein TR2A62_3453 [Thalassobium sp. R2A62]|nr:hypothetical protein TR2A62_3453 [Thalassobium sp. R2A62]
MRVQGALMGRKSRSRWPSRMAQFATRRWFLSVDRASLTPCAVAWR